MTEQNNNETKPNGKKPVYKGNIKTKDNVVTGAIALWDKISENPKAPQMTGEISYLDGTKQRVALWKQ